MEVRLIFNKSLVIFILLGMQTLFTPIFSTAETIEIPDVGNIVIPEIMEVKDLLKNIAVRNYVYKKMNVDPKSMEGVQQNLMVKQKGMKLYARIIVETIPGKPGDYERIKTKYVLTSEDLKATEQQIKSSFESQFEKTPLKILQWYPMRLVDINGMRALHFSFRRQLNNNPEVLVNYFLFQNYDKLIRLTASYRLDEKEIWQDLIQRSINSFRITPYISEKGTKSTSNDILRFDGCEYTVKFPIKPKLCPVRAGGKDSIIAITSSKDGMPILRAECQPIMEGAIVTRELIMSSLEEQARSIGLRNVQVTIQETDLGLVGTFFGKKNGGGYEMAQMGKIYVGKHSILNLLSTELLSRFPSKKTNLFFGSVRR